MRLYHLLVATAAALLAGSSIDVASAATCRYRPSTSSANDDATTTSTSSSFSFDAPTNSSDEEGNEASAVDPLSPTTTDAPASEIAPATTEAPATTDASTTTDASSSAAATPSVATNSSSSTTSSDNSKLCAKPRVVITEVDVGATVENNEDEAALKVVAIAALPSGGSRIAFHSGDNVIVRELDANDKLVSSSPAVKVPMNDFADIYADKEGFVLLGTRDAEGGGTLNCGNPSNLCGTAPNPAVPC